MPDARRVSKGKRGRDQALLDLIRGADATVLAELIRQLAAISPETERACFEYLRKHVAKTSDAKAGAAAGAVFALWSELEPDLAELDEYGGGDHETEDQVGELLYELAEKLQKDTVPRDDRRALLDEVLPYIRSGNAGMDDALYDVAYAACRDDDDLRDLAERFETLGKDWPVDHARRIYRRLGNRERYLALRGHPMKYGADYHDLATFHWEQGERQQALEVAREGLRKAQGRMDELRTFLAERAQEAGDRQAYVELQFAQATQHLTLATYKAFRELCHTQEWAVFEPRVLDAMKDAWKEEQLKIFMHRGDYDQAVGVLCAMRYPNVRVEGAEVLKIAAALEEKYPDRILTFYLSGLPKLYQNATRETYARWVSIVAKVRHMWVDALKTPTKWDTFARQLKAANLRRSAFQAELAKVVPGWSQL
jgi:hypothetical protein